MDWLQFASTTLGQLLSWPVAALILGILFRRSIASLLNKLQSWKNSPAGDFDFGRGVGQAESAVDLAVSSIKNRDQSEVSAASDEEKSSAENSLALHLNSRSDWSSLASENPSYLILATWERLDEAIRNLGYEARHAGRIEQMYPTETSIPIVHELATYGIVNRNFVDAFQQLRTLRNKVAHGRHNPTTGESLTYADSAEEMIRAVQVIGRNLSLRASRGPATAYPSD